MLGASIPQKNRQWHGEDWDNAGFCVRPFSLSMGWCLAVLCGISRRSSFALAQWGQARKFTDPKDYMSGKRTFTLGSGQRICESATHQI